MSPRKNEQGLALVTALMLLALLMAMLSAYFLVTTVELSTTQSTMDRTRGFYAAEAGLNIRGEEIRQTFVGYNVPAGASPTDNPGELPCQGADLGSGDYRCQDYTLQDREVLTYINENAGNPTTMVVPRGEPFQNLNAMEYGYRVNSLSVGTQQFPEAILEMYFRSRLVPMFQFAAFYNKDLEILPGPDMTLAGPVHCNGDLYLDSDNTLTINGQTTTAGSLYHGRKNANECHNTARVYDPAAPLALPACAGNRIEILDPATAPWNGMIRVDVEPVTVPEPEVFDPTPGALYWDRADLRIVLDLDAAGGPAVQIRQLDNTVDAARSATLNGCMNGPLNVARRTNTMYNRREGTLIDMLDIHAQGLMNCIQNNALMGVGKGLDDASEGGLVWYLTVEGANSAGQNNYGVRVSGGSDLSSTVVGAPAIRGLTVVTDQAVYVQGNFNSANKKPASFLGDSMNILSNAWLDSNSYAGGVVQPFANRNAVDTTMNAAFLAGTDVTGGVEGVAGQDSGLYNGGLENYPRFHENWQGGGQTFTYRGSFVSLYEPQHVDGPWIYGSPYYKAPIRNWSYDTDFNDPTNLPPLSPRFVYLRQDLFVRHFEM